MDVNGLCLKQQARLGSQQQLSHQKKNFKICQKLLQKLLSRYSRNKWIKMQTAWKNKISINLHVPYASFEMISCLMGLINFSSETLKWRSIPGANTKSRTAVKKSRGPIYLCSASEKMSNLAIFGLFFFSWCFFLFFFFLRFGKNNECWGGKPKIFEEQTQIPDLGPIIR